MGEFPAYVVRRSAWTGQTSPRLALKLPTRLSYRPTIWLFVAFAGLAMALCGRLENFSFTLYGMRAPLAAAATLIPAIFVYRRIRPDPKIAAALECVLQLAVFSTFAEVLSYIAAATHLPFHDEALRSVDAMLHLNWVGYLSLVKSSPFLTAAFSFAYKSLEIQIFATVVILCFSGKLDVCRRFTLAFIFACLICILVSRLAPSLGMYPDLHMLPGAMSPLQDQYGLHYVRVILELRATASHVVTLKNPDGVISFPSVHAALAILFIAAHWAIKWARWPSVAVNGLVIASTPIIGGHYFIDIIVGMSIAALSWKAARLATRPDDSIVVPAAPDQIPLA